jgi:membrane-bound lytic murein transglycosylase D
MSKERAKNSHFPSKNRVSVGLLFSLAGILALPLVLGAVGSRQAPLPRPMEVSMRPFLSSFKLPDKMFFAGQPVPLDHWQVRERIEYEFYQFLGDEGDSIIIAKRTGRCFPLVERMLAEARMPDDLKYVLLVESKCVPAATSSARAAGPWQFVPSTGRRFNLERNYWKDERRDLERSTEAAIEYLKVLHEMFGDWYLALAAYNTGERRVHKSLRDQQVDNYWKTRLSRETMRYVPRILAVKEIFSKPEKYLGLAKMDLYVPVETEVVTVEISEKRQHLSMVAADHGSYYLELKLLNPEIRKHYLPSGTHQIKIPRRTLPDCPPDCGEQHPSQQSISTKN